MKPFTLADVALSILNDEEIPNFYQQVLGAKVTRNFILDQEIAGTIFGINKATSVFLMQTNGLTLELFVMPEENRPHFRHFRILKRNGSLV